MIEQHAIIISTESLGDDDQLIATIEVVRKTACGLCGKTRGCGNAFWGKMFAHKATSFKAHNGIDAKVGQSVIVGIDESALMKSALLLYVVPLVAMFIGAIFASLLSSSDLIAMAGAAAGVFIGFLWVKAHTLGHAYYQNHQPKILRLDALEKENYSVKFQ